MKRIYTSFLLSLVVVSCVQHEPAEGQYVTINAVFPSKFESKVTITEKKDDTGLELKWEETDQLLVTGESSETFVVTEISGNKASFTGKRVQGDKFDIVLTSQKCSDGWSYLSQNQVGTDVTDHLEYRACLKGVDSYSDVHFTREWAQEHGGEMLHSGVLLLYFQLPEQLSKASTISQVKLESSSAIFYSTDGESSPRASCLTMNIADGQLNKDRTVKAYLMTSMKEISIEDGTGLRLTAVTDRGIFYKDIALGNVSIMPGKRNVIKLNSKNWQPMAEHKDYTFMSYNVGKFQKYKEQSEACPEAAAIMKYYGVDIVGLNEIEYTTYLGLIDKNNQPKLLANEMGYGWQYTTVYGDEVDYGNAVVASPKLSLKDFYRVELPCEIDPTEHQTRSLGVLEYEDFIFCVTHLDHKTKACRPPQLKIINDWIKEKYGNSDKPIILTGDMNAIPGADGTPNIVGFGDYWKVVSVTEDAVTYPTQPAEGAELKCLDYVLIWKNDNVEYYVNKTEVVKTCPGVDVAYVSDHYPVYVDMTFIKKYDVETIKSYAQTGIDRLPNEIIYEEDF